MTLDELNTSIALGEDSRHQFKRDVTNADSLAAEMAAFANSEGGVLFLGVADDGSIPGLGRADVMRLNQLIGNVASQHVRSPLTVQTENVSPPTFLSPHPSPLPEGDGICGGGD